MCVPNHWFRLTVMMTMMTVTVIMIVMIAASTVHKFWLHQNKILPVRPSTTHDSVYLRHVSVHPFNAVRFHLPLTLSSSSSSRTTLSLSLRPCHLQPCVRGYWFSSALKPQSKYGGYKINLRIFWFWNLCIKQEVICIQFRADVCRVSASVWPCASAVSLILTDFNVSVVTQESLLIKHLHGKDWIKVVMVVTVYDVVWMPGLNGCHYLWRSLDARS